MCSCMNKNKKNGTLQSDALPIATLVKQKTLSKSKLLAECFL